MRTPLRAATGTVEGYERPCPLAAILEPHQQPDGSVVLPEAIRPYLGGLSTIEKQ